MMTRSLSWLSQGLLKSLQELEHKNKELTKENLKLIHIMRTLNSEKNSTYFKCGDEVFWSKKIGQHYKGIVVGVSEEPINYPVKVYFPGLGSGFQFFSYAGKKDLNDRTFGKILHLK